MAKAVYIEIYYNQRTEPEMVAMMTWTRAWWDNQRHGYDLFCSAVVLEELEAAEHPYRSEKVALVRSLTLLPVTEAVEEIAEVYLAHKVMPRRPSTDALHLALASFHGCDILLT